MLRLSLCLFYVLLACQMVSGYVFQNDAERFSVADSGEGNVLNIGTAANQRAWLQYEADLTRTQGSTVGNENNRPWRFIDQVDVNIQLRRCQNTCEVTLCDETGDICDTQIVTSADEGQNIAFDMTERFRQIADDASKTTPVLWLSSTSRSVTQFSSDKEAPSFYTYTQYSTVEQEQPGDRQTITLSIRIPDLINYDVSFYELGNCTPGTPKVTLGLHHLPLGAQLEYEWAKENEALEPNNCIFLVDQIYSGYNEQLELRPRDTLWDANIELVAQFYVAKILPLVQSGATFTIVGLEFGSWAARVLKNNLADAGEPADEFILIEPWVASCPDEFVQFCTFSTNAIITPFGPLNCDLSQPANLPPLFCQLYPTLCAGDHIRSQGICHNRTAIAKWIPSFAGFFDLHNFFLAGFYSDYNIACNGFYGEGGSVTRAGFQIGPTTIITPSTAQVDRIVGPYDFPGSGGNVMDACFNASIGEPTPIVNVNTPQWPRTTVADGIVPGELASSRQLHDEFQAEVLGGTLCANVNGRCVITVADQAPVGSRPQLLFHSLPEQYEVLRGSGAELCGVGTTAHYYLDAVKELAECIRG